MSAPTGGRPEVVMRARPPFVLAVLLLASAARAQPPAAGPFFGLHAGYGIPTGDVARGGPRVEDVVEWKVPLGFDVGYRFNRRVWAQLFFDLAPASAASELCTADVSCSASDVRLGLGVLLRLAPRALLDPWVGAGIALEVMNAEGLNVAQDTRYEWSWFGLELPFAEAGVDIAISDRVTFGPWLSATIARFTSESERAEGGSTVSGGIDRRSTHGWLSAGVKATLKL